MSKPLYFDYAATTPVDPSVAEKMMRCLTMDGTFGNPASRSHRYGWQAEELVDEARGYIAELINADPREIIFTSGATESNNLALKGAADYALRHDNTGNHNTRNQIITLKTEHKAVLDTCEELEQRGFEVVYLDVQSDGQLSLDALQKTLCERTLLVSVMHVNNETGVCQDIAGIAHMVHAQGALFHVDAAQSAGKLAIDVKSLDVDLLSISAHKMYGPKGIGALFVRRQPRIRIHAQIQGGGHERGMRSGTLPTHQIVGFGEAARLLTQHLSEDSKRIRELHTTLWAGLKTLAEVTLNGQETKGAPGILNITFGGVDGELLLMSLKDLAVSTGSACNSASVEPSYVLTAMGLTRELAHSSVRFSMGRYTSVADVQQCIQIVRQQVATLREQPSAW